MIVGKYVSENGIVSTIRQYEKDFDDSLKESTVCRWRNLYMLELKARKWAGKDINVKAVPTKMVLKM